MCYVSFGVLKYDDGNLVVLFQSNIALPSGATIIKSLPPGMLSMAKPGTVPQLAAGGSGKQTIVIASPKPSVAGALPTKIITAVPRSAAPGGTGTQYIVVTTRPGGVAGAIQQTTGLTSAAGRVIRMYRNTFIFSYITAKILTWFKEWATTEIF